MTDEFGGSLTVVRDGAVADTLTGQTQPGGVAAVDGVVGVIDVRRNDLTAYDAATLRQIGRVAAGEGPTHVVAETGTLFVTGTADGSCKLSNREASGRVHADQIVGRLRHAAPWRGRSAR